MPGHTRFLMPNVQLAHLQSQIKALMNHYADEKIFRDSLFSLLNLYSQKENSQNSGLFGGVGIPSLNIPAIVLSELNAIFEQAAQEYPEVTFKNSEVLAKMDFLETKMLSFSLLLSLPSSYQKEVFNNLRNLIHEGNSEALNEMFLDCLEENTDIMLSEKWLNLIEEWLQSENLTTKKIGLSALTRVIQNKDFDYFPKVFTILTPLFSEPTIEIRHDLIQIVREMISRTEQETASFLISIAKLHANNENRVFIRKCLPLFSLSLQNEMKNASDNQTCSIWYN